MPIEPFRPARIDDREAWRRIADAAGNADQIARQLANIEKIPSSMTLPTAADYLAARRSNDRARLDDHWRKDRPRFTRLALDRLLKGVDPNDGDDRLLNWAFAYTYEPTWVVSAHLPNNDLPLSGAGQLDLAGCEAAGELAEFREALLPWIDANSKTLGDSIVREIDRRVLGPFMTETPWWARLDAKRSGEHRLNNWTGVCAGSILVACQSFAATGLARDAARDRAIALLRLFFDVAFGEAGECEEGIGYWNYGVAYACLPMMRMTRDELAASFDLERVRVVANYPERCHIYGSTFFCGNDGEPRDTITPGVDAWLADLVESDFLRYWGAQGDDGALRGLPHLMRYLQQPKIDGATTRSITPPRHPPARLLADQQAAIFQRPSSRGLFTFTVTGGTNAELHNHNDLGTFQVFLDDRPIVPDLGRPAYTTDFFKDETRYTKYLVAASGGHCCPAINGVEQRVGIEAAGVLLGWSAEHGEIALDLTSAYPPAARLKRWHRSTHVPADAAVAILTDEFALDGDGVVVHRIWSRVEPKATDGGATIALGDDVVLRVEPTPTKVELPTFKPDDPRLMLRGYPKGATLYRIDLTYAVAAGKPLTVTTRIEVA